MKVVLLPVVTQLMAYLRPTKTPRAYSCIGNESQYTSILENLRRRSWGEAYQNGRIRQADEFRLLKIRPSGTISRGKLNPKYDLLVLLTTTPTVMEMLTSPSGVAIQSNHWNHFY